MHRTICPQTQILIHWLPNMTSHWLLNMMTNTLIRVRVTASQFSLILMDPAGNETGYTHRSCRLLSSLWRHVNPLQQCFESWLQSNQREHCLGVVGSPNGLQTKCLWDPSGRRQHLNKTQSCHVVEGDHQ